MNSSSVSNTGVKGFFSSIFCRGKSSSKTSKSTTDEKVQRPAETVFRNGRENLPTKSEFKSEVERYIRAREIFEHLGIKAMSDIIEILVAEKDLYFRCLDLGNTTHCDLYNELEELLVEAKKLKASSTRRDDPNLEDLISKAIKWQNRFNELKPQLILDYIISEDNVMYDLLQPEIKGDYTLLSYYKWYLVNIPEYLNNKDPQLYEEMCNNFSGFIDGYGEYKEHVLNRGK